MAQQATEAQPPTLARQIIDLDHAASDVLIGMIAGHFATSDTLTRERLTTYLAESLAVTR